MMASPIKTHYEKDPYCLFNSRDLTLIRLGVKVNIHGLYSDLGNGSKD